MRKSIIISAALLPVVAVPAAAYLLGIWPGLSVQKPETAKSKPAISPVETKLGETRSAAGAQKTVTEEVVSAFLDVARIDPKGPSVFAGRAAPHSEVTVLADNEAIGTVKADNFGEWALIAEKPVPAKDSKITLRAIREKIVTAPEEKSGATAGPKSWPAKLDRLAAAEKTAPGKSAPGEFRGRDGKTAKEVTSRLMERMKQLVETAKGQSERKAAGERASPGETHDSEIAAPVKTGQDPNKVADARSNPYYPGRATSPSGGQTAISMGESGKSGGGQKLAAAMDRTELSSANIVPVPIKFVFKETAFTPEGVEAAKLLLAYVKLKKFDRITLSGHADERGTEPFNYELSRERLEAVSEFLKTGGFQGKVVVVPKGEKEPFRGVNRREFSQEELWQLDRRVELHITQ